MTYRLRVSRRAGRQIREASGWWLRNRNKAPFAFADDLDDALHLIADLPRAGEPVHHTRIAGVRRLLLTRTRYHLGNTLPFARDPMPVLHVGRPLTLRYYLHRRLGENQSTVIADTPELTYRLAPEPPNHDGAPPDPSRASARLAQLQCLLSSGGSRLKPRPPGAPTSWPRRSRG